MNHWYRLFTLVLLLSSGSVYSLAQATSTRSSNDTRTQDVVKAQEAVNRVLFDAGISFTEGLLAYVDNNRALASHKFNKSVESFLYSSLNLQREQKLQGCYDALIETVYRVEFPFKAQNPHIPEVAGKCGWKLDDRLVDRVTKLVLETAGRHSKLTDEEARSIIEKQDVAKKNFDIARKGLEEASSKLLGMLEQQKQGIVNIAELEIVRTKYDLALNVYSDAQTKLSKASPDVKDAPTVGFERQTFEPSPLDELAKLELAPSKSQYQRVVKAKAGDTVQKVAERNNADPREVAEFNGLLPTSPLGAGREVKIPYTGTGETWQTISNRTGVSVADLMAANPGMATPRGKVFVPVSGATVNGMTYSRPSTLNRSLVEDARLIGAKPLQAKDGKVSIVINYFNEVLHDPYSMRIVRWSDVTRIVIVDEPYWMVAVKYRAKNLIGAYVLSERVFYIRRNKIVSTFALD